MAINIEEFKETIEDHMKEQPYKIKCMDCGSSLDVDVEVDGDFDLRIEVKPCNYCMDHSYERGYEDGEV
jgi:hypothetical protein